MTCCTVMYKLLVFFCLLCYHSCHKDRMYLCPPIVGRCIPLNHLMHSIRSWPPLSFVHSFSRRHPCFWRWGLVVQARPALNWYFFCLNFWSVETTGCSEVTCLLYLVQQALHTQPEVYLALRPPWDHSMPGSLVILLPASSHLSLWTQCPF